MKKLLLNTISGLAFMIMISCTSKVSSKSDTQNIVSDSISEDMQHNNSLQLPQETLTKIYTEAIAEYIRTVNKRDKIAFDTLYFGKHVYGQADDFPDITLPSKIEKTTIKLVSPEIGLKIQQANKSIVYINMIGWVDKEAAKFIFVTFSNACEHQFDCFIDYLYKQKQNKFELENIRFEDYNK